MRRPLLVLTCLFVCCVSICAQAPNATVSGRVLDPSGAVVPGTQVRVINDGTNVEYSTVTNDAGIYSIPSVPPGKYHIQVSKNGFKNMVKPDVVLHVQDGLTINFTLELGAASESVTVEGGAPLVNAESGSVSTVIDRNFVESLPLNGRSFNTLLQLTPGVTIAPTNAYSSGQFSISGQRTSANNFLVDGVSANFGVSPQPSIGTSGGSAQAFSALGGTSSLVSVETLQEFRVETSSFAAEFGRSPGGQVILHTRSGTNQFHGGIYEYFRNDVLDANNWFANQALQARAPERHNDFGGFFGGPIRSNKTFFFVSDEGARLRQPNTKVISVPYISATVPSCSAPASIAAFLQAYPKPNGAVSTTNCTGTFTGSYSNPATLDAGSVRIDHTFSGRFSTFGRYNEAPSVASVRIDNLSEIQTTDVGTRTLTIGATMLLSPSVSDSLRGNYSLQTSSLVSRLDSFGGAFPPSLAVLAPKLANADNVTATFGTFDTSFYSTGPHASNRSAQVNFADDLALSRGSHQVKVGADYRAIYMDLDPADILEYLVSSVPNFLSTSQADFGIFGFGTHPTKFLFQSTSLYGQDTWRITPRLTVTYGIRWELDPAPSGRRTTTISAWRNVNNAAAISLAPFGSSLWSTTYTNFAPRIGVAYSVTPDGGLVLRAGWGMFYDLGTDTVGFLGSTFPNSAVNCCPTATLPLADATPFLPVLSTSPPFPDGTAGFAPNLKLPRSYQWNVALEKSFQGRQALSVTYVGQAGRDLLRQEGLAQPNGNFGGSFLLTVNSARSNYNALQVQYRRPLANNLQALASYTWSHSLDIASNDTIFDTAISSSVISTAKDYASSSFDVRNSFSGALNYLIPSASKDGLLSHLTRDWSIEGLVVARGGFPFNGQVQDFVIAGAVPRPNLVRGQPTWLNGGQYPGGKALNPLAFTVPPVGQQGTEGRNDIRGFGLTQVDLSIGRKFAMTERLNLQFRADVFNAFNHPNFANPFAQIGTASTLVSQSMLNGVLGGLNPLFQEGGPRSLQLSLKLTF